MLPLWMIMGASGPGERIFSGLRSPYGQVEAMVKFELLVWEYCDSIHSEPMYSHHEYVPEAVGRQAKSAASQISDT